MRLGWVPGPQELVGEFHHFELVGFVSLNAQNQVSARTRRRSHTRHDPALGCSQYNAPAR